MEEISAKVPRDLVRILKVRDGKFRSSSGFTWLLSFIGKVSLGKAAEIAGISKWEMMEILASRNVPIQYDVKDLEKDIKTVEEILWFQI